AYTADDARTVARALQTGGGMRAEDAVILTDREATRANVEAAVRQVGQRAGPQDLFVFFYSGHGARVRRDGPQSTDPDALDETLEFFDRGITDDEFSALLSEIAPGISMLVLDACFSGGFSKDVVSVPGRIGFFSSEEDVTSSVAAKFRAGGYLAHFVGDAVGEKLADADGDGAVSAIELSQYLYERYRSDVKSGGAEDFVRTGGPQTGYQHLVVDRGSIGPSRILFR
ncbi:MAG: caspase family protein, partial [Gemmatimonadetes bacterium]|nr:caspase family protein [Gemmatimonadota bacterium]